MQFLERDAELNKIDIHAFIGMDIYEILGFLYAEIERDGIGIAPL